MSCGCTGRGEWVTQPYVCVSCHALCPPSTRPLPEPVDFLCVACPPPPPPLTPSVSPAAAAAPDATPPPALCLHRYRVRAASLTCMHACMNRGGQLGIPSATCSCAWVTAEQDHPASAIACMDAWSLITRINVRGMRYAGGHMEAPVQQTCRYATYMQRRS